MKDIDRLKHWNETNVNSKLCQQLRSIKHRCKKLDREYDLSLDYVLSVWPVDDCCPILGHRFVRGAHNHPHAPSIDRIDNDKGYTPGNIRIMSRKANAMKSNASNEELLMFAKFILEDLNGEQEKAGASEGEA